MLQSFCTQTNHMHAFSIVVVSLYTIKDESIIFFNLTRKCKIVSYLKLLSCEIFLLFLSLIIFVEKTLLEICSISDEVEVFKRITKKTKQRFKQLWVIDRCSVVDFINVNKRRERIWNIFPSQVVLEISSFLYCF